MAGELIASIQRHVGAKAKVLGALGMAKVKVAVWPFKKGALPVPDALIQSWDEAVMEAMVRINPGALVFVTRRDLATIIKDMSNMDIAGEIENPVSIVAKNAAADILVIGGGLAREDGVDLSYRAVEVKTGAVFGVTSRRFVAVDFNRAAAHAKSMRLSDAFDAASKALAEIGPVMSRLSIDGVRHAASGVHTGFGQYVARRTADALQTRMNDPIAGNTLKVVEAGSATRGLDVSAKKPGAKTAAEATKGDYALSGTYWVFDHHVDLRLSVRNAEGDGLAWSARIHKASIPNAMALIPTRPGLGDGSNDGLGPIGLELTSDKGRNPIYAIGEKMVLLVRTSEDARLHCFYEQVDGQVLKIFPNPYVQSSRIKGLAQRRIPDPAMPFEFTVSEPPGVESVKCFAMDRDPGSKLPLDVARNDLAPLEAASTKRLSAIYRAIPDMKITEATMVVTVKAKE